MTSTHVKQKWGELRVYFRCHDAPLGTAAHARLSGLCDFSRRLSVHTCETCGAPGRLLVGGNTWRTSCATHVPAGAVTPAEFAQRREQLSAEGDVS